MDDWVLQKDQTDWPLQKATDGKEYAILSRFFEPMNTMVVLANANQEAKEVHVERCQENAIPILKRKGGGGTVVLNAGCVVWTLGVYVQHVFENQKYFSAINTFWMNALAAMGVKGLCQRGISDICLGEKKIAGTSMFRRRHLLLYQASLLVNPNLQEIAYYLRHPSQEPDYRGGRDHLSFITSLQQENYPFTAQNVVDFCAAFVAKNFVNEAGEWLQECDFR